jgi:transposase
MDAKEILNIIKIVENSINKDNELKKLKINKSTYYNWLRKYNNGGLNALDAKKKKWTSYEVNLLLEKVKTHEYIIDIQKYLPNRTCASISVKLMELGVSIEEIRREKKLKRTTKICKQCNSEKKLSEYYKIGQGQR